MTNPPLPASPWPLPDEDVRGALEDAYRDGSWGRYEGPATERLLAALRQLCELEHVQLVSSGTIAVELALRGLRVAEGDEVILAGYDFPGNFRAIEAIGARPVLVDLKPGTWSIDVDCVRVAIGPRTKAIIVSHLHGCLADMPALLQLAAAHQLGVVEDACQSPGGLLQGRPTASWGDVGVLSFGGSKLLTAGRGGALVSRRADVMQRIKVYCDRGNQAFPLSELQASVLIPQIAKLAQRNQIRGARVQQLVAALKESSQLTLAPLLSSGDISSYYKLALLHQDAANAESPELAEQTRAILVTALQSAGAPVDVGFRGFVRRSSARCRTVGDLPHARRAAWGTLLLHHPILLESPATIDRLAAIIKNSVVAHCDTPLPSRPS